MNIQKGATGIVFDVIEDLPEASFPDRPWDGVILKQPFTLAERGSFSNRS